VAAAIDASGTVIGLAAGGVATDENGPTAWELYSINVAAEQQGSGVADDLIRATVSQRDASVWVLRDNDRAQAFYRRHGFSVEGATRTHEGTGAPEIRMMRRPAAADR